MVWDYRHSPDIYADAMGSGGEAAPNGNTPDRLGAGRPGTGIPALTEAHPDNSTGAGSFFFRRTVLATGAYKYHWVSQTRKASVAGPRGAAGEHVYVSIRPGDSTGIAMTFKQIPGTHMPAREVTRYSYAPLNPVFPRHPPLSMGSPVFSRFRGLDITSLQRAGGRGSASLPGEFLSPGQTLVYVRPLPTDPFSPLPHCLRSSKNELVFTTTEFGDLPSASLRGVAAYSPVSDFRPKNNGTSSTAGAAVKLLWGTRGIVQTYRVQVAADSTFASPVVDYRRLDNDLAGRWLSLNNNAEIFLAGQQRQFCQEPATGQASPNFPRHPPS